MSPVSTSHSSGSAGVSPAEPAFYNRLDLSLGEAWRMLEEAVGSASKAFHQPVLATTGLDGSPKARVVVLRGASAEQRELRIHTDWRSGKVAELRQRPQAMLLAYDAAAKLQLRLSLAVQLHHQDALSDAAWQRSRRLSRHCYRLRQAPASELAAPEAADFQPEAGEDCGQANFCLLRARVERIEWLYLSAAGHRRAGFDWDGQRWNGRWLAP